MIRLLFILLIFSTTSSAQQLRYIDESGNINFVDSLNQVPMQYRNQVLKPTPTPNLSPKERKKLLKKKPAKTPKPKPTVRPTRTPKPTKTPRPTPMSREELLKRRAAPTPAVSPLAPLAQPVSSPFVLPERPESAVSNSTP